MPNQILITGNEFVTGNQVTAATLNAAINAATFKTGSSGATDDNTISVDGSGRLFVKDSNITAAKLATNSVTTVKITDANVTPAKLSAGAPSWTSSTLNVAGSLDFSAISTTATPGTYGRSGTTVTISMTAHGMTTGMVATFTFVGGTGGTATAGTYVVTVSDANTFTITDTASGTITGSPACSRTSYYGTSRVRGSETIDGNLTVSKNASITGSLTIGTAQIAVPSGPAPLFMARAFVSFDSTRNSSGGTDSLNTARFIYGSKNVTSVTKIASGQFRVAITTALPDTNYCVVCNTASTNSPRWAGVGSSSLTTTQFDIYTDTGDGSSINQPYVSAVVFG